MRLDTRGIQVNQVIILFCKQVIISQSINQSIKQNNKQPKISGRSVEQAYPAILSGQSKQNKSNSDQAKQGGEPQCEIMFYASSKSSFTRF
jgi:hypothetical protein